MIENLLIIFIVAVPLIYLISITYKSLEPNETIAELDRIYESLNGSLDPNKKLKEAAEKYLSNKPDTFLQEANPEDNEQALELLKTLYINYIQDLSPYRIQHLDFFDFASLHESLHLFSSDYNTYKLSSYNSKTPPVSLESFILIQTP